LLLRLKNEISDIALRTTLIVGYPNETENDFKALCDFCKGDAFHRLGVFTYSKEEGTAAFELDDSVSEETSWNGRRRLWNNKKIFQKVTMNL